MHLYLRAIRTGWHGRYIGKFILLAIGIAKSIRKTFSVGVRSKRSSVIYRAAILVNSFGQCDVTFNQGTSGSNFVYDCRILQILSVRVLDTNSPCYFVGVGVISAALPDTAIKFSRPPLPVVRFVGTYFIIEFNVTVTCGSVFGYLNAVSQLIAFTGI